MTIHKTPIKNHDGTTAGFSISGDGGDNTLNGTALYDEMSGGAGNDVLSGGKGDDVLQGGLGRDVLKGGSGFDAFIFKSALGGDNIDRIADLDTKIGETITLDMEIFKGAKTIPWAGSETAHGQGTLHVDSFWVGAKAHDADDRIIYDPLTGTASYDVDGSGDAAAIAFAQVKAGMLLKASDFMFV